MEYLDFSSVITTIRKYINDERTVMDKFLKEEVKIDQLHLMDQVFSSFCDDEEALDFTFDNGQVCRWFNGQARISPRIISFYIKAENSELLSADVEYNVLPLMYDSSMAYRKFILCCCRTPPFPMRSKTSWPPAIPVKPTGRKLTLLLRCCFSVWSVNSGSVMQIPKIF